MVCQPRVVFGFLNEVLRGGSSRLMNSLPRCGPQVKMETPITMVRNARMEIPDWPQKAIPEASDMTKQRPCFAHGTLRGHAGDRPKYYFVPVSEGLTMRTGLQYSKKMFVRPARSVFRYSVATVVLPLASGVAPFRYSHPPLNRTAGNCRSSSYARVSIILHIVTPKGCISPSC